MAKHLEKAYVSFDIVESITLNFEVEVDDDSLDKASDVACEFAYKLMRTSFKKKLIEMFKAELDCNPYIEVADAGPSLHGTSQPTVSLEEIAAYLKED